jgi:hypothetical protein
MKSSNVESVSTVTLPDIVIPVSVEQFMIFRLLGGVPLSQSQAAATLMWDARDR